MVELRGRIPIAIDISSNLRHPRGKKLLIYFSMVSIVSLGFRECKEELNMSLLSL